MRNAVVIGCGKFGYFHAEKYASMKDVSLIGVCDLDVNAVKRVCNKFGCAYSDNYKDFASADLVSIATPNATHYHIAEFFINQGADVLVEKPMTESSLELQDLISRSKSQKVRLWGGYLERYNSVFRQMAHEKYIEEVYAHRSCAYRECRIDEDVVFDLMVHDIFLTLMLVNSRTEDVEVEKKNSLSNCNDFVRAKIQFEDGIKADLTARRDIKEKTKLFCSHVEGEPWKIYNLKKKNNDTLYEQLKDFADGYRFDVGLALRSMQLAERILGEGK
jgi:predicted dehydrogenase